MQNLMTKIVENRLQNTYILQTIFGNIFNHFEIDAKSVNHTCELPVGKIRKLLFYFWFLFQDYWVGLQFWNNITLTKVIQNWFFFNL